ncbi:MAG: GHMP kinase [Verrucomicrobia bacterium]|jgi:mevalonate kinase|nr:GHMP kinase [Verrucomicrobiota bacterium]
MQSASPISAFDFPNFSISASAPGSLMITGEHAVLHDRCALVGAVDQRVQVTLSPRPDDVIAIHSALGEREMPRHEIDTSKPFNFLGAIFEKHREACPSGFDLTVTADFPADVGLGSSAAVTVATLAAISTWLSGTFPNRDELLNDAVAIIRDVQGRGSGSDAAAAVYGGILLYEATPKVITRYPPSPISQFRISTFPTPPIALVYAGYKTTTPEVIRIVERQRAQSEDGYESLFNQIDANSRSASEALQSQDWTALGQALSAGQKLMEQLGVCDEPLADIVSTMNTMPNILGAKISGSGLGDCVLGIGTLSAVDWPYRAIPVRLSTEGVRLEEESP